MPDRQLISTFDGGAPEDRPLQPAGCSRAPSPSGLGSAAPLFIKLECFMGSSERSMRSGRVWAGKSDADGRGANS